MIYINIENFKYISIFCLYYSLYIGYIEIYMYAHTYMCFILSQHLVKHGIYLEMARNSMTKYRTNASVMFCSSQINHSA